MNTDRSVHSHARIQYVALTIAEIFRVPGCGNIGDIAHMWVVGPHGGHAHPIGVPPDTALRGVESGVRGIIYAGVVLYRDTVTYRHERVLERDRVFGD